MLGTTVNLAGWYMVYMEHPKAQLEDNIGGSHMNLCLVSIRDPCVFFFKDPN